jgi:hypothetical protein
MKHAFNLHGLALFLSQAHRGFQSGSKRKDPQGGFMKMKNVVAFCAATLAFVGFVQAQDLRRVTFSGTINDYTPSSESGGPWEMRGEWSLDLLGTANFSADFSMETSDYGITDSTQVDPTNPATRSPHTHHIVMSNATVSYDTSTCPANKPPSTGPGVTITGTATTSANGSPAPFESMGPSTLQVCIIGGSEVEYSNVTLVYTGPATSHFGTQAIHGVVRKIAAQ